MGYRSTVKIKMGKKAYELLEKNCLSHEDEAIKAMVQNPDIFRTEENSVLIGWSWVKWNYNFKDVRAVEDTLRDISIKVEKDESLLSDYFYKKIELGEDNRTTEDTNDYDDKFTDDFYIEMDFSL